MPVKAKRPASVGRAATAGSFKPGDGHAGRPRGAKNKMTVAISDMLQQALERVGGVDYLVEQAKANPGVFLSLVGRLLPLQVTGKDGQALISAPVQHIHQIMPSIKVKEIGEANA